MRVILAEKPSVARDIARVIGADQKKNGWIEGRGCQITWAFGHLITIAEPGSINKQWGGKWNFDQLPMIPETFPLTTNPNSVNQFNIISKLFNEADVIINATDAGREGELIFRWIYKHCTCTKPFKRLWISDLTDESIKNGLENLFPGENFNNLGESAQCRAFADWMVGLNATRAYSIRNNELFTVGRVQTPTLALIVDRFKLIQSFQKFYYYELYANCKNVPFRWENNGGSKIEKKEKAELFKKNLDGKPGEIVEIKRSKKKTNPPPLYDLTLLQKECNEKYGFTAQQTLEFAQVLYEKNKLITYPRTESRHLSEKMRPLLPIILKNAPDEFKDIADIALERIEAGHKLGKNYIDDKKLTDHHAIIPTNKKSMSELPAHLKKVYYLVFKRFVAVFLKEYLEKVTEITMKITEETFRFKGSVPESSGWKIAYQKCDNNKPNDSPEDTAEGHSLSQGSIRNEVQAMINAQFKKGGILKIDSLEVKEKETSPPKHYTDGTLLNAMRFIGRQVDDKSLAAQLKDQGLGTQATRAAIIERLIKTKYIFRKGKNLLPTEKGIKLIDIVIENLKSPEMTAMWETKLTDINDGKLKASEFMDEIEMFTKNIIPVIQQSSLKKNYGICPKCKQGQVYQGNKSYYCSRYREGCNFILWSTIASKPLLKNEVEKILKDGSSDLITGFKSKTGKLFDAIVVLDKEFKTQFKFKN